MAVSDDEIVTRLLDILKTCDLNTTTTGMIRRKLEEDFGIDLSKRKAFVREQVNLFMKNHMVENGGEEDEVEKEVKEEEEEVELKGEGCGSREEDEGKEECHDGYKTRKRGSKKAKNTEVKRKGGGGFCKISSLSLQLQEFTGTTEMARTEVVKRLWLYIKEKNLQDPSDKRNILCDEKLKGLFKVDRIHMFQMIKALAKHIWPLESGEDNDEDEPKKKGRRLGNSGYLTPLKLSDALVRFLGTGESELSRPEVVRRIWHYIKEHSLQDPSDKRQIRCDEKLKELFQVESFHGITVTKLVIAHLTKLER